MNQTNKIIEIDSKHVACNGGDGSLGHPTIYLEIAEKGEISCPYCSNIFKYVK